MIIALGLPVSRSRTDCSAGVGDPTTGYPWTRYRIRPGTSGSARERANAASPLARNRFGRISNARHEGAHSTLCQLNCCRRSFMLCYSTVGSASMPV